MCDGGNVKCLNTNIAIIIREELRIIIIRWLILGENAMLKSLKIKNFRMLEDFQVSKLGRVNLIVGKNNSGKSSVLEALRIYAGNAQHGLLSWKGS